MQIFNEEMFSLNNLKKDYFYKLSESVFNVKDLNTIDKAFDDILNKCVVVKSDRTNKKSYTVLINKDMDNSLSTIEKTVKKIFNIDLSIKIDTKTPNLQYFACIFITEEDVKQAKSDIEEIIKDEKYGYHYIKIKKADMLIQPDTFSYVKDFNGENKLSGRHLTAILLHEIGHKIYLKLAYNKTKENEYLISINDCKPKKFTIKSNSKKKKLSEASAYIITFIVLWITLRVTSLIARIKGTSEYTRIESYSDRLAIQYGYGKEIYQFFLTIELWCKGKITTDKNSFLVRLLDADYIRRKEMKANIIKEINDTKNDPNLIKELKVILKFIEDIEKDAEEGNYRYNLFNK